MASPCVSPSTKASGTRCSAIVDTSVATILSGMVLYQYGTGPVRGFAVTLIAGVVRVAVHGDLRRARLSSCSGCSRSRGVQTLSI